MSSWAFDQGQDTFASFKRTSSSGGGLTRRYTAGRLSPMQMSEADWRTLRRLQPVALERLCERILAECVEVASGGGDSAHGRYLKLFDLVRLRNKELAHAFDDVRRSTAILTLIGMYRMGLLADEEFGEFSAEARAAVERTAGIKR